MNPWGFILVVVGILMMVIGFTGSQHEILAVIKGIPASARGAPVKSSGGFALTPGIANSILHPAFAQTQTTATAA